MGEDQGHACWAAGAVLPGTSSWQVVAGLGSESPSGPCGAALGSQALTLTVAVSIVYGLQKPGVTLENPPLGSASSN